MFIPRSIFYGNRAIIYQPELPDYESESDLSYIVEDEIIKETDDISDIIDNDNSDVSDDANSTEADKVKSKIYISS